MPDLVEDALSRAAMWGGAAPMQDPRGLAALAQFAGERERANAQVGAAGVEAAGKVRAADLASAAHERSLRDASLEGFLGHAKSQGRSLLRRVKHSSGRKPGQEIRGSESISEMRLKSTSKVSRTLLSKLELKDSA